MTAPEYRTQVKRWFVETGVCDGDGMGHWIETEESVEVAGEVEANALRDSWLASGKLRTMPWGELRPQNSYALFRIRQVWEDTRAPLADPAAIREAMLALENFINEPPKMWPYEPMEVRDYRHALYPVWLKLVALIAKGAAE